MACLEIRLLGPFHVTVDGDPATGFESDSTRALLALLASEPGRAWSRPTVAEMFWPDRPPGAALSNLRHVLSGLRKVLSDSRSDPRFVRADRNTVSLDASCDFWVDVLEFEQLGAIASNQEGAATGWERAVDMWRGPFLEDLNVHAGAEWEEWQVVTGERLRRCLVGALRALATHHERAGDLERAVTYAQHLVEADVYEERAYRQLMRILAASGERARALLAFEDLSKRLEADLATDPAVETAALAERIRVGTSPGGPSESEIAYPDFLTSTRSLPTAPQFVGKERELGRLEAHLAATLGGHGRVVLIAGEAGTGKTVLAMEFARRAMARSDLLVANGRCNAYGGLGDPYLPFREMLGLLTGDVESGFAAGTIGREQATRLWEAIPQTARLVGESGLSLVGVMVDGLHLVGRCRDAVPEAEWLGGLQQRAEAVATVALPPKMQPALFDEYTAVLAGLTATRPTVLIVDDLQWGDHGSIALLWHLSRRLEGSRLLILGLYRPEEIHDDHPLRQLLVELQTDMPEGTLELGSDREFIDALVDSEPNQLDTEFRSHLFSYTDGHPLLAVEMVRGMQERAELRRNRAGLWITQEPLDWRRMPKRGEAVIAQRISRLSDALRDDLTIAAVQGEEFLGETVAAVREDGGVAERLRLESRLPHRLIAPSGAFRVGERLVAAYRFRHILFQRYLYDRLSEAERLHFHEHTGRALEDLYQGSTDAPVVDLAHHFDEAGLVEPAISYLHQAAQRAFQMSGNEEAFRLLQRALSFLSTLPESPERDQHELDLLVGLSASVMAVRGYTAPEAVQIGRRITGLCDQLDPSPTAALALFGFAQVLTIRAFHREADRLGRDVLAIGQALDDSGIEMVGRYGCGYMDIWLGDIDSGWRNLERTCQLYDQDKHAWLTHALGMAIGPEALAWGAVSALHRGYPEQAFRMGDEGIAMARKLGHPFTLCHALGIGGSVLRMMCGDYEAARPFAEEAADIAEKEHFPFWVTCLAIHQGSIAGHSGDPDGGVSDMKRGLKAWHSMGVQSYRGFFYSHLAELERMRGRPDRGLEIVEEELKTAIEVEEALSEAYVRLQIGSLKGSLSHPSRAADKLEEAAVTARRIGSRLLELQAATRIAQLHTDAHRPRDAAGVLEPVLSQFTEGLETPHLVAARSVLASL